MTFKSSLFLAFRWLFPFCKDKNDKNSPNQARKSVFAAIFCVALSLIPLVVVLVVANGLISGMTGKIIELSSFHIQAVQYKAAANYQANIEGLAKLKENVEKIGGVTDCYIERSGVALAAGKKERGGVTVRGVENSFLRDNFEKPGGICNAGDTVDLKNAAGAGKKLQSAKAKPLFMVEEGEAFFADQNQAIVGNVLAQKIGVKVGDTLRLITIKTLPNGTSVPKIATFTVCGIVSCGYQELDALWVFVPLEKGFEFLSSNVSRIILGVKTADAFSPDLYRIADDIQRISGKNYGAYTWQELDYARFANFRTSKLMLMLVMCLIVLVACVNISSALIMLGIERRKEIAILKSLGARPKGIKRSFVFTGFFCGVGGVVLGLPLGVFCALFTNQIISAIEKLVNAWGYLVYIIKSFFDSSLIFVPVQLLDPAYYLETIPISFNIKELFGIAFLTILLSVLVSLLPAYKAAKEKPLDTLRKL